jgi:hypothetical protein
MDLFQITCPSCGSKLNAKIHLIGQTRNCPKCQTPILIQRDNAEKTPESTPIIVNTPSIAPIPAGARLGTGTILENLPKELVYHNRYFILSSDRVVAMWETGKGWQVNVGNGFASAKKNFSAIPDQGTFSFVKLEIDQAGIPTGLSVFKISQRGALTSLYRDDTEILHKIDCIGELSKNQKNLLFNHLRQIFIFEVFAEAKEVTAYLNLGYF